MRPEQKSKTKKPLFENTPANNLILIIAIFFGIFIFALFIDNGIQSSRISSAKNYTKSLKQNYENLQKENARLEFNKKATLILQKQFDDLVANLPVNSKIDQVLEDISKIGANLGLKFVSFKPQEVKVYEYYSQTPINMTIVGTYHNLAQFLSDIANLKQLVTISDFKITRENPTIDALTMHMTVIVFQHHLKGKSA